MAIFMYDNNKVGIISTKKENYSMVIESNEFYDSLKSLFDVVWDLSKIVR